MSHHGTTQCHTLQNKMLKCTTCTVFIIKAHRRLPSPVRDDLLGIRIDLLGRLGETSNLRVSHSIMYPIRNPRNLGYPNLRGIEGGLN